MINNNQFEKTNFRTLIEKDEIGRVEDRLNIINTFLETEKHVTFEDLIKLLRDRGYDYDPNFVRQCRYRWVEQGCAPKGNI